MATNYAQICEENIRRYGTETAHLALLGDLYSERTHFIFELLQNAEDAKATQIKFRLSKAGLELSHDGRPFSPDDVRGIASICRSTNQGDPERIGRFGIGFKSVYAYTTRPEIHSGDEHFAIQHYVRPQPTAPRNFENGVSTLIVLPFNAPTVTSLEACKEINSALAKLDPINLLFLRRVQEVVISTQDAKPTVLQRKPLFQLAEHVRMVGLMVDRSSPHAAAAASPPTQSSAAGQSAASVHELVQCKQCPPKASWIRKDRLQRHILKAHGNQPKQGPQKSGGGSKSFSVGSSSLRRCRSCGGLAVPGHDYCYSCQ
jgi:hypothetical protein